LVRSDAVEEAWMRTPGKPEQPASKTLPKSTSKISVCDTASTAAPDLDDLEPCLCPDSPMMCTPRALPKPRPTPAACLSVAGSPPNEVAPFHSGASESEEGEHLSDTLEDPAARARRSLVRA